MKGAAAQYVESPVVLKAVANGIAQGDDEDCRRNACFCLSVVYEVSCCLSTALLLPAAAAAAAVGAAVGYAAVGDSRKWPAIVCLLRLLRACLLQVAGSSPAVNGKSMEFLRLLHPVFRPRDVRLCCCCCCCCCYCYSSYCYYCMSVFNISI